MSNPDQGNGAPDDAKNFKAPVVIENAKYRIGQKTRVWGDPDEFNDEYQDALRAGYITQNCELTEAGVAELVRLDTPKPTLVEKGEENQASDEATSSPTPPESRPAFMTSATARQHGHESLMGDGGRKRLMDSIQLALEERGFNILDVYLEEKSNNGGEKIYTLSIEFAPTGGKDRGKKEKKILRLVGNEDSLVSSLRRDSFNIPTSQHSNKKLKRAFGK